MANRSNSRYFSIFWVLTLTTLLTCGNRASGVACRLRRIRNLCVKEPDECPTNGIGRAPLQSLMKTDSQEGPISTLHLSRKSTWICSLTKEGTEDQNRRKMRWLPTIVFRFHKLRHLWSMRRTSQSVSFSKLNGCWVIVEC